MKDNQLPSTGLIPKSNVPYIVTGLIPGRTYLVTFTSSDWGDAVIKLESNIGEGGSFHPYPDLPFLKGFSNHSFIAASDTIRIIPENMSAPIQARIILCK